jgi:outer membrane protein TolC
MEDIGNSFLANNYKMGLYFSMPLFLRTERGKLQSTKIKIQDNNLALQQINRDIATNLETTHNELLLLAEQITAQETLARQTELLRNGEQIRFENGESSLFLVNTREMNLVNQRVKLWELRTKYAKGQATLNWAAGNLGNQ